MTTWMIFSAACVLSFLLGRYPFSSQRHLMASEGYLWQDILLGRLGYWLAGHLPYWLARGWPLISYGMTAGEALDYAWREGICALVGGEPGAVEFAASAAGGVDFEMSGLPGQEPPYPDRANPDEGQTWTGTAGPGSEPFGVAGPDPADDFDWEPNKQWSRWAGRRDDPASRTAPRLAARPGPAALGSASLGVGSAGPAAGPDAHLAFVGLPAATDRFMAITRSHLAAFDQWRALEEALGWDRLLDAVPADALRAVALAEAT